MLSSSVALLLVFASAGAATPFSNCGFTGALVDLELAGCDKLPCDFNRGAMVPMTVRFRAVSETTKMTSVISGMLDNIPIPLSIDSEICSHLSSGRCPASTGEEMTYATNLSLSELPAVGITIEWYILDQHGQTVLCAQVPARIS